MTPDDIVCALEGLHALVRDPVTQTYALRLDRAAFRAYIDKWESKGYVRLNSDGLVWTSFVQGRSNLPAMMTVAPREEFEEDEEDEDEDEEGGASTSVTLANPSVHGDGSATPSRLPNGDSAEGNTRDGITPTIEVDDMGVDIQKLSRSSRSPKSSTPKGKGKVNGFARSPALPQTPRPPSIPPTRFEIYPPIPGSRKKPTRPSASRRRTGGGTSLTHKENTPPVSRLLAPFDPVNKSLRRTRSKMSETTTAYHLASTGDERDPDEGTLEEKDEDDGAIREEERGIGSGSSCSKENRDVDAIDGGMLSRDDHNASALSSPADSHAEDRSISVVVAVGNKRGGATAKDKGKDRAIDRGNVETEEPGALQGSKADTMLAI
jgi:histone acetyltransferase SAS3